MAIKTGAPIYELNHLPKNDLITELYNRYGKKLYAYAINNWHLGEDDAWDLIYKTLYKVIASYRDHSFENESKFASYVFKIFINYLRNHYRDHKKDSENMNTQVDTETLQNKAEPAPADNINNPKLHLLNEELDRMEDWQRMLLLMRSEGTPYAEIAKYIDKPEDQLKVYYQRLKEQISRKLNGKS